MGDCVMRIRVVAGAALMLAGTGALLSGGVAGGQVTPPRPALVTDFAAYPDTPQAGLTPGCDESDIVGRSYSVNGGPALGSLQDLPPVHAGDVVAVSWTDVGVDCDPPGVEQSPISLAMKSAPGPTFDPAVNQPAVPPYELVFLTAGQGGTVALELPDLTGEDYPGCSGQLDAVLGVPLAVVGPDGSFYSASLRGSGPNLLLSAWNGTYDLCVAEETTTTTEATTTTTEGTTSTTEGTTTTSTPSTTTTSTPSSTTSEATTTTAPSPTTTSQLATTITDPPSLTVFSPQAEPRGIVRSLASTGGGNSWGKFAVGVATVALGGVLLLTARQRARRQQRA